MEGKGVGISFKGIIWGLRYCFADEFCKEYFDVMAG